MRYALCLMMIGLTAPATQARADAATAASALQSADSQQQQQQPQQPGVQQGVQTNPQMPSNIKLDLAITDTYSGAPVKRTVSMLILSGQGGMIRTSNRLSSGIEVKLNIDAMARIQPGGSGITVQVTFEYSPAQTRSEESAGQPAMLHESLNVMLQNGKPLVVSQSADPATERRVTVELTGTILK